MFFFVTKLVQIGPETTVHLCCDVVHLLDYTIYFVVQSANVQFFSALDLIKSENIRKACHQLLATEIFTKLCSIYPRPQLLGTEKLNLSSKVKSPRKIMVL